MKTGINFQGCNIQQSEAERWRMKKYAENLTKKYGEPHWHPERTFMNKGWHNDNYGKLSELLAKDRIECKKYTGRKMQAKATPIREGVCPCKADTKIEDFDKFKEWLHKRGIEIIEINIHHDEGHYDPYTGEFVTNHHAHIVADWFNHATGRSVSLGKQDCREMQTVIADSLGMERGTAAEVTKAMHLTPLEYKAKKQQEEIDELYKRKHKMEQENMNEQKKLDLQIATKEADLNEIHRKGKIMQNMLNRTLPDYSKESRRIADLAVKYEQLQGRGSGWREPIATTDDDGIDTKVANIDMSKLNMDKGRWHQTTAEDVKAEFIKTAKALVPNPQNEETAKMHYKIFASSVAIDCISRLSSRGLEDVDKLFQEAIDNASEGLKTSEEAQERMNSRQADSQNNRQDYRSRLHL